MVALLIPKDGRPFIAEVKDEYCQMDQSFETALSDGAGNYTARTWKWITSYQRVNKTKDQISDYMYKDGTYKPPIRIIEVFEEQ